MEILPLELSRYEIELTLYALAKLPYEQSGAVIENIMEQMENERTGVNPCALGKDSLPFAGHPTAFDG